ncbi:hypothetical protein HQ531_07580 [bacterium]|nr:hypothetical protein [bacterium]
MSKQISNDELVIHFLNVGFGDNIIIEFPKDSGERQFGIVDCKNARKTEEYLEELHNAAQQAPNRLAFICATHPHYDHISGIRHFLDSPIYRPHEFWDSGFRHKSLTYQRILESIVANRIKMVRVSSGMEWYFGNVQISALAPSIDLRNRYATYGVDMNNASIVLRFENNKVDSILKKSEEYEGVISKEAVRSAGQSVVILTGDAEFDSWAHVVQEYPKLERSSTHQPLVNKMINNLNCAVIKVSHHGSMHSTPLDVYEKMSPAIAVISTKQEMSTKSVNQGSITRGLFPHDTSVLALEECDAKVITTDGSYEDQKMDNGTLKDSANAHPGSIVLAVPPGGRPRIHKLDDGTQDPVPLLRTI